MPVAVALLDVDDFTSINESLGHAAADDLLTEIARRLRDCLSPVETAGRFGGDEFAVLFVDADASAAEAAAARMLSAVAEPVLLDGKKVSVHASIGIATGRGSEDEVEALIRRADAAMRSAKQDGKACIRVFDEAMHAEIRERLDLEEDLPRAIDRNELDVHYQPVVTLHTGRVVEVEALVRWHHPTLGTVPPGRFIPVAEERGLITTIGAWVLRQALNQLRSWRTNIPDAAPRRVAVNVSARQLADGDLVDDIKAALVETGLHGSDLTLEITETLLMEDTRTAKEKLRALRDLSVHIAVDDFGSGYASLSYLKQFPIDILKIDRSIIDDIDGPPEASGLPHAIVKLGNSLRMRVVAEGIERIAQRDRLIELGCALGQGYLFSKPLAAPELEDFLRDSAWYNAAGESVSDPL
jgi:diguanylate cyclase (GGDEF)-like protein